MIQLGIDLGTCNSLAAFVEQNSVRIVPNARGKRITPSVVGFDGDGALLVGETAGNLVITAPDRTVRYVKRAMGDRRVYDLDRRGLSPEEISAAVLADLRRSATAFLGAEVREAVVTVPAHFDDRQRHATLESAMLAGFRNVRLLNEPTAAALPYATREREHERIVVFDFGGGTLDVTCLERTGTDYIVRATEGDGQLGGTDIDRILFDRIAREIESQSGTDIESDPHMTQMILQMAETAKIDLSDRMSTTVTVPFFAANGGVAHPRIELTRDELEEQIVPITKRALAIADRAVAESGFIHEGFDVLVFAGGSSRLPVVRRSLQNKYDVEMAYRINPDEIIASGAALYAANSSKKGFSLHDVLSSTLSIELADGSSIPILRKNQPVPSARTRVFTTVSDRQKAAEIHLLQGSSQTARNNRSLGRFVLGDILEGPKGEARIAVTVSVNDDGVVRVDAGDKATGSSGRFVARARPESRIRPIHGDAKSYLASLLRRLAALKAVAIGDLVHETEQILSLPVSSIGPRQREDHITVVETLLNEIVSRSLGDNQGASRAAS